MDPQFQTSFIPKKAVVETPAVSSASAPSRGGNIFGFLATIFFIGAIVSAAGVYLYYSTTTKKIKDMAVQIDRAQKEYDTEFITQMRLTDKRLESATEILGGHIIVSPIFLTLQELTLKSVAFNHFEYSFDPKGQVVVSMKGKAANYEAIALQSDMLSTNRFIKDPVFSNLNLDDKGRVTFELEFIVDRSYVNYVDTIAREQAALPSLPDAIEESGLPVDDGIVPPIQ